MLLIASTSAHRVRRAAAFLAALLAGAAPLVQAQTAGRTWTIGPPAAWVKPQPLPQGDTPLRAAADSGRLYVLVDHQVRAGGTTTDYRRYAWTALSTAGVQNASEVQMRFDPSFERLVIHHVRLLRDGRDVFSFRASDVRVIQQERSLDEQIYSGELTAVVFLRDLRPGDTLDYAYSVEGANPILGGGLDDELALAFDAPVRLVRHTVLLPASVPLHITPHHTALAPVVDTSGGWRTYTWSRADVAASGGEDDEPGWFDPDPRVEVSTFGSWAQVADWARALFEGQLAPSPELAALADRLRKTPGGPRAAAAEAVRFVQDDVRYLGIEMGPSSHQPHPPGQVLRQRFGDCKDKSLLLVALLRAVGVDAAPALVDTVRRRGLDGTQPSPFAFDHAIVQAVVEGREVWIDATESDMGGPFEDRDPPEFERALVLRPGTRGLTAIPRADRREPAVVLQETFTLGRAGAPARLDVLTTYRRSEADAMRRQVASTPAQELARSFLDDYARDDADLRALAPPSIQDDRGRNVVLVSEAYEMPSFWKGQGPAPNTLRRRTLRAWEVEHDLPPRVSVTRATPLEVAFPVHVRHEIVVRADQRFRLGRREETITCPTFAFTSTSSTSKQELRLTFDYRSLADSVPPEGMKAYMHAIDGVEEVLSFQLLSDLTSPDAPEDEWASPGAMATGGAVLAVAAGLAAWAGTRARRRKDWQQHEELKPDGLR